MICKKCGSQIDNGTYCINCESENSDNIINNQLDKEKNKSDKTKSQTIAHFYIVFLIIAIIIQLIFYFMNNSFNSCVEKVGHKECGLGTLCDKNCMPPFYFTMQILQLFSGMFLLTTPLFLILYLYYRVKEKNRFY